ncbi:MAG: FAD-dependent oxidoreductase [Pseudomonadota bacterium]
MQTRTSLAPSICDAAGTEFDTHVPVLIVGAGACGLIAALAAGSTGAEVLVLERDGTPSGSTTLSSGFIPAAGTRFQLAQDIQDGPEQFAADIQAKAKGKAEQPLVELASRRCGEVLEWLADRHGLEWTVLDDFLYPGHTRHRMHAVPEKTGAALMARLLTAAGAADVPLATNVHAVRLLTDGAVIKGAELHRPAGEVERIGCDALVLACNGYGGNEGLVRRHIPEMAGALYFGHDGNQGDAVCWGEALGAGLQHLSGYQGHGSVAVPHGILVTWALMMEGGIQVNQEGRRFSNEHRGYSEQSLEVLAQPGGVAWNLYDERLHKLGLAFDDYRNAVEAGAVRRAGSLDHLAMQTGLPGDTLRKTLELTHACQAGSAADKFGRDFTGSPPLAPPWYAVKVTGALFHTQGGLLIDQSARVLHRDGEAFPNLYAAGGAACGVSGPSPEGYLSGNGLLTAVTFGAVAGWHAGRSCRRL